LDPSSSALTLERPIERQKRPGLYREGQGSSDVNVVRIISGLCDDPELFAGETGVFVIR
jgi:hypothetical protein